MRGVGQKLLVATVAAIFGILLLELGGALVYRIAHGKTFSRRELQERLLVDRVESPDEPDATGDAGRDPAHREAAVPDQPVILHPFFGFVINPAGRGVNEFGFFAGSPLARRGPGRRVILFTGGSVADQVYYLGQDALRAALRERDDFRGRDVEILTTAVGGYKQPQQMMILSYLLARGAEFDVVVNIDGFNEIDSSMDNVNHNVNPFFPHTWKLHARLGLDTDASALLGRIAILRAERSQSRARFSTWPLRAAAFTLVLWDLLDRGRQAEIRERTAQLRAMLQSEELPAQVSGPPFRHDSDAQLFADLAAFWARSSLQMARLCDDHGIAYVHALQPNQYLPGSKTLNDAEREVAWDEEFPAIERVPMAYPMLIEHGAALRRVHGVNFVDLTQIFAGETRTIYDDFCCHVNRSGAEIMARAIAAAIPELP